MNCQSVSEKCFIRHAPGTGTCRQKGKGRENMSDNKKIKWSALAFMAFSTVWSFGNVVNGFIYFNGIQVILSWFLMFLLYFIPYSLMVGELGSAFKNSGSGVNSWGI